MPNGWIGIVARSFIDTNILLYADDRFDAGKQRIAIDLLVELRRRRAGVLSIQVLSEYYVNAVRKLGLEPGLARRRTEQFGRFEVVKPSLELVLAAIDLHRFQGLSYWDAMILQAAMMGMYRAAIGRFPTRTYALRGTNYQSFRVKSRTQR